MPFRILRRSNVAVIEIHGVIGNHVKIPEYSKLIDSVAKDTRLKALVPDIDSPDGSATGSEVLHRSLQRVAKVKLVYTYIRGMGASGGYYLACASSKI